MSVIEESVDVNVSAAKAYEQWTRFEEFPRFMEGVESVTRVGQNELHWKAEIGGKTEEWTARITEDIPERRLAWAAEEGVHNAGAVTFHPLNEHTTRIMLQLEYDPESLTEKVGDAMGVMGHRVRNDLGHFKQVVEDA